MGLFDPGVRVIQEGFLLKWAWLAVTCCNQSCKKWLDVLI